MVEDRTWGMVLSSLKDLTSKVDQLIREVSGFQQSSNDRDRRLAELDAELKILQATSQTQSQELARHAGVIKTITWAAGIAGVVVIGALAVALIRLLPTGL